MMRLLQAYAKTSRCIELLFLEQILKYGNI